MRAKSLMIQGTMSGVGKSLLVAGLCRILAQDGYRVAPFKSQNMALNSAITRDGLEIGRAQAMQAEAAGIEATAAMNPVLLKPTTNTGSQVIVRGRPIGTMPARDYFGFRRALKDPIREAYDELARAYDVVIIEGAGSPAEINLLRDDIVNMGIAKMTKAPVLLVGDIDRGGVFAQLIGTMMLLAEDERRMVRASIVNKFRGDASLFDDGVAILRERMGVPVAGVVPYMQLDLDDEDSMSDRLLSRRPTEPIDVAVVRLPKISNFTDFIALDACEGVGVRYVSSASELGIFGRTSSSARVPDLVILPGTKATIADLLWMRSNGLESAIRRLAAAGVPIIGICGGYQMLGISIADPDGVEVMEGAAASVEERSGVCAGEGVGACTGERAGAGAGVGEHSGVRIEEVAGLGLLPVRTVFGREKRTVQVAGTFGEVDGPLAALSGAHAQGYEIHMGKTTLEGGTPLMAVADAYGPDLACAPDSATGFAKAPAVGSAQARATDLCETHADGCQHNNVYGSYLHGLFDSPEVNRALVSALLAAKGLDATVARPRDMAAYRREQYDALARGLRACLDMDLIYRIIEEGL